METFMRLYGEPDGFCFLPLFRPYRDQRLSLYAMLRVLRTWFTSFTT